MTDYTDLIARLRSDEAVRINWDDHINGRLEHRKPTARELEAADALEAQARRIAELETKVVDDRKVMSLNLALIEKQAWRIAELEAALKLMIDTQDEWERSVSKVIGKQPNVFNRAIDAARAAYKGEKE